MKPTHQEVLPRVSGDGVNTPLIPASAPARLSKSNPARPGKRMLGLALLIVAVVAGWGAYRRWGTGTSSPAGLTGARAEIPPVPVVMGIVSTKDVPIYLDGLGTVQAFATVTVRARVDGQLMKVAFTEGQDVKAGDLLAQIDPAPYQAQFDQAVARKSQDEAQLANARLDLKRYADLLGMDSTTQQTYDTQQSLVNQLEATIKADQATSASAKVNLDYTTIRSPIDGRVGIRQVDQGNIVHANDASGLVVLTQLRPISVVFTLPEQALSKLQRDKPAVDFPVLALSRDNTTVLGEGCLAVIDNHIDTTTATIRLKANFPNEDLRLWPGQFVNARLWLDTRKNSPVVPASVVQRGPDGAFAFVIQDDQTVRMRPLKVAQIERGEALIDDGLLPGERVVVDGQYKLQAGSRVRAAEAAGASTNAGDRSRGPAGKKP